MGIRTPPLDIGSTIELIPSVPVDVDPGTGRPLGAGEPHIYRDAHSNNPTYSPLNYETHTNEPFSQGARISESPVPSSIRTSSHSLRWDVLRYLIVKTYLWVLTGVLTMLLGIGLSQAFILPRIHTCPPSATCSGSYDLNSGNSLQLLQTFMSYWLKAGVMVSSIGMLKLSAYQAWFILMHQGNTVKNLDLNLGAIRGSVNDACSLLLKKNNRLLSLFVLALLGIDTSIQLATGLSIAKEDDIQYVTFRFNGTSDLPNSSMHHLNTDGQLKAIQKVVPWALDNDRNHGTSSRGTLVIPDARATWANNALPAGPKINGWFECQGWDNYTLAQNETGWYIWVENNRYIAKPNMSLSVALYLTDTALSRYVWASNTTGLIPNATATKDGGMNIALCVHHVEMIPEEPKKDGVDYLVPTAPQVPGCGGTDTNTCVADSVNNAIINWWGGLGTSLWGVTCRGGLLGPIPSKTDKEKYCPITQELWRDTTIAMLDGIIQTAPSSVPSFQDLPSRVEGLSKSRWWLNATIPAGTVVIYLVGLVYTCMLSQGDKMFKELSLEEVMGAAQTDHVHDLILTGKLRKAPIRYHSDVGFIDNIRSRSMNS